MNIYADSRGSCIIITANRSSCRPRFVGFFIFFQYDIFFFMRTLARIVNVYMCVCV